MYEQMVWSNTTTWRIAAFVAYQLIPMFGKVAPIGAVEKLWRWFDRKQTVVDWASDRPGRLYPIYTRRRWGLNGVDQHDFIEDTASTLVRIMMVRNGIEKKGGVYVQA